MPPRVLKEYDERRNELLDAAQRLFIEQGYESTSVNAIIDSVGVAKGTFYHYFKSKTDLLDSLVERMTARILAGVRIALEGQEMDAITKLNLVFQASARWKADNREALLALLRPIYSDENVLLRLKMTKRSIEATAPLLTEIIAQGVREGVFDIEHPGETADMVMSLSVVFRETHAQRFLESWKDPDAWVLMVRRAAAYQRAVEKILGAPKGSVRIVDQSAMNAFRPEGAPVTAEEIQLWDGIAQGANQ